MKLCLIYNYAQHYRTAIFKEIDSVYDCDFYFGDSYLDVKKMDYRNLRGIVTEVHNIRCGHLYFQKGVLSLLKKDYDAYLIFSQIWCLSTWLFLVKAKYIDRKKVYAWAHGWYGKESRFVSFIKRILYSLPTGIFVYGAYARQLMINEGLDGKKIFVIHNSLDYNYQKEIRSQLCESDIYQEHFKNKVKTVIFIGRLTKEKKLEMLVEAMAKLKKVGRSYNLMIVGNGGERGNLEDKIKECGLESSTWLYGESYDERELAKLIYNADICVSPGNVGLTAIHSMTYGTPVITHDNKTYQMPEFETIKDGITGTYYKYDDVSSLARSIETWLENNSGKRGEIRNNCIKEIESGWTPAFQIAVLKQNLI